MQYYDDNSEDEVVEDGDDSGMDEETKTTTRRGSRLQRASARWASAHPVLADPLPARFQRRRVFHKFIPSGLRAKFSDWSKAGATARRSRAAVGDSSAGSEGDREDLVVHLNDPEENAGFAPNVFITSRYTVLTFLPKNLFEQARRVANLYFIFVTALQFVPGVSPFPLYITLAPLVFILGVVAIKEGYEDYLRHRSDARVNNRAVQRVCSKDGSFETVKSRSLRVGEIIAVNRDEVSPADVVVLSISSSAQDQTACWVDTANLDGETRLKVRRAVAVHEFLPGCDLEDGGMPTAQDLVKLRTVITADAPNPYLEVFSGRMDAVDPEDETAVSLQRENLILRGAILRNTKRVLGVVVGAGKTTKLRMNQQLPVFKFGHLERKMNVTIFIVIVAQTVLCVAMATAQSQFQPAFRDAYPLEIAAEYDSVASEWVYSFMTWFILMSFFVPMSLYVVLEIGGKLMGGLYIHWDRRMYSRDELKRPAVAITTSLVEELGSVEFVLSDKTGTLTDNEMRFSHCSISRGLYVMDEHEFVLRRAGADSARRRVSQQSDADLRLLLQIMATCNTVEVEQDNSVDRDNDEAPGFSYSGESPDEVALALAARDLGATLTERAPHRLRCELRDGTAREFRIAAVLPFTSVRKRMAVVLREQPPSRGSGTSRPRSKGGKALVWYKGADNVMFDIFGDRPEAATMAAQVHEMSKLGLRTLVMGAAEVDTRSESWSRFERAYADAEVALEGRDELVGEAFSALEPLLRPVGCTGVEDKLSEGVGDALQSLVAAGIQVAVLTGDKTETAMSICTTCGLFQPEDKIHLVADASDDDAVSRDLRLALGASHDDEEAAMSDVNWQPSGVLRAKSSRRRLCPDPPSPLVVATNPAAMEDPAPDVLVLSGECLRICLENAALEALLVQVMSKCKTTVCTRMTPKQKALVTRLVRDNFKKVTLSIGDGANDVSMIREADVGVGVFGKEGSQAVNAADFAIHKFADLKRLIFVHGAGARLRIVTAARASLGINIAFNLPQVFFGFASAYSGQSVEVNYVLTFINAVMTSPLLFAIAMFDRKLSPDDLVAHPELFSPFNVDFGLREFTIEVFQAIWMGLCATFAGFVFGDSWRASGELAGLWGQSTLLTFVIVSSVLTSLVLRFHAITVIHVMCTLVGTLVFWLALFGLSFMTISQSIRPEVTDNGYVVWYLWPSAHFWLLALLGIFFSVLPQWTLRAWVELYRPDSMQIYGEARAKASRKAAI